MLSMHALGGWGVRPSTSIPDYMPHPCIAFLATVGA
jgi:hypothetical protein